MPTTNPLTPFRKKLEKWELQHLNAHASDLADRLECANEALRAERGIAEYWHEAAMEMMGALIADIYTVGITKEGVISTLPATPHLHLAEGETYVTTLYDLITKQGNHIILLPGDNDDANWQAQKDWAASIGGDLPTRVEQAMLWENHRDEFKKDWYWSCESHHSAAGYAWCQYFSSGTQDGRHKDGELRARAVRRLPI